MQRQTQVLIREYVRQVLREDDYSSILAGDHFGGHYGAHYGSSSDLYNVFIKPFVDVVQTAAGKTKEISQRAQTTAKVAFEALATSLIPALSDSYAEIFAEEERQIQQIRSEYAEVYNSTWDAFRENDVLIAAFLYRPDLFLTATFAKHAPQATAKLLSVLSGGTLDSVLDRFNVASRPLVKPNIQGGGGEMFGGGGGFGYSESVIREESTENQKDKPSTLEKLVVNPKIKSVLQKSPIVRQMTKQGQELVRDTLKNVFEEASAVLSAKTLSDLQKASNAKLKGLDELQSVPEQERQKVEQLLLATTKKSMKTFYIKQLEAQVKSAIEAGTPDNHPYVQDYQRLIAKIKAL